jgi:hypothetical protein
MSKPTNTGAGRRRIPWLAPTHVLALVALAGTVRAAPVEILPHAEVDIDHNDNLFLTPSDPAQLALTARPLAADTLTTLFAGLEINKDEVDSSAYLRGEARRIDYRKFKDLSHNEYNASVGYTNGALNANHLTAELGASRQIVPFLSLASDNLFALELQRYARLSGQLQVGEYGRIDALAERHDLRSPVPGSPDYGVAENVGNIGFTRGALESLEYGARVQYVRGHYTGHQGISDYTQWAPQLFLKREVKRLLRLNVTLGAARRTQEKLPTTSGFVGGTDLHYQFTARTSAYVGANRTIYGYYASAGSQADINLNGGVSWAASYRLTLLADYSHVHSEFDVSAIDGARSDNYQLGTVSLAWQPTPWLTIRAYARKQKRDSTSALYLFDATGEGIAFRIQRPERN